jgi:anaphase-promoting complex subunit 1
VDPLLSKTLCLHIPALLPPQHWDIDIPPLVQCSALVGLGLLYCGSGHRLMTEFLLAEVRKVLCCFWAYLYYVLRV